MIRLRHRLASLLAAALLAACSVETVPQAEKRSPPPSRPSTVEGRERPARSGNEGKSHRSAEERGRPSGSSSRRHGGESWTETDPPINRTHLFEGQVNRRGKPVGFHARPGGVDPAGARRVRVIDGPNRHGVYVARVEIRAASGKWLAKTSTFYPDELSEEDVIAAILAAFERSDGGQKWRGDSGQGFTIEGYFQDGRINTAYPIFRGSGGR